MKILHIANGDSAAGTLKVFFKKDKANTTICFNDFLSIGPLMALNTKKGIKKRSQYLYNLITKIDDESYPLQEIQNDITSLYKCSFSDYDKVIVWGGNNASEELVKLLCCNLVAQSQLYKVNVSEEQIDNHTIRAVGECSIENIKKLLPKVTKISAAEFKQSKKEWNMLSQSKALLRIYALGQIIEVSEDYFDEQIIEICTNKYLPLLRIVGEVIGRSEQLITDTFIIYRILHLMETKRIEYSGDLKNIRTLLVKRIEVD